jgi:hypothetical protein
MTGPRRAEGRGSARQQNHAALRKLALALGVGLAGSVLWLSWPGERPFTRSARAAQAMQNAAGPVQPGARHAADYALMRALAQTAREQVPVSAHETAAQQTRHPLSAEHLRLYRDVDLLHAADQAIREQRFDDARALLAQHHRELPGMSSLEEEGLLLLADCAERRSPENLARVQAYYDRHSASSVRRRLRRACLEQE